jgi:TonB family protein
LNGTRVTYDGWMPVGSRYVPTIIRLTRGKKLLLEAHGTVQVLQTLSPDAFQPPPDAVQVDVTKKDQHNVPLGEPQSPHQIVHREPMRVEANEVFGYVIVRVEVGTKGRVTKAEVVDSDDPSLEHNALEEARGTIWEPYEVNGQLTPFEDEMFFPFRAPLR